MSKASVFIAFVAGAAVGVGCTHTYFKKKYADISQDEINSVKESLSNMYEKRATIASEKPDIQEIVANHRKEKEAAKKEMADILANSGYVATDEPEKIYVISPQEFGEIPEYEKLSLMYHADGVVTDDEREIIVDWADLIGPDFMTHFGEYEDDSVFVRNTVLKADYEILKDLSPFHDPDD